MTYAPATLQRLGTYWTAQGGVNLGIVGDTRHTKGYHLGKDRIYDGAGPGLGDRDYSVQHARDKAGLTNAASAIDLGRLDDSLGELRRFSLWLVRECQRGAPGTGDIREVIYADPATGVVMRYDRLRGQGSAPRPGEADDTHKTHSHVSWFRDSERREKVPTFAAYFAVEETDMPALTRYIPGQVATIKATANIRSAPQITPSTLIRAVPVGGSESWTVIGWCKGDVDPEGGSDQWLIRWGGTRWEYTAKSNVSKGPAPAPDSTPFGPADIEAAKAGGFNTGLDAAAAAVAAVPRR